MFPCQHFKIKRGNRGNCNFCITQKSLWFKVPKKARLCITYEVFLLNIFGNLKIPDWKIPTWLVAFFIPFLFVIIISIKRDWVQKQKSSQIFGRIWIILFGNIFFQKQFLELSSCLKLVSGAYFLHIYPMEIL